MKFLLGTDSVSYALRGKGGVAERRSRRLHRLIDAFVGDIAVVPFDDEATDRFGKVATALMSNGTPIGVLDTMIAAHALRLGLTLVTHDLKHFRRVRGLEVADWA